MSLFSLVFALDSCKDACKDLKCQNGGDCIEGACQCPKGFTGLKCETIDSCATVVCYNNGVCQGGWCDCPPEWDGISCQTVSRVKLLGSWIGFDDCEAGNGPQYATEITIDSLHPDSLLPVWVYGLATNAFQNPLIGYMSDQNIITIPNQDPDTTLTYIEAVGTFNPATVRLNWAYTLTTVDNTISCTSAAHR